MKKKSSSSSRRGKAKDGDEIMESLREDGSFRSDDEGEVDRFASLLNPSDYSADGVRPSTFNSPPPVPCLRSFVQLGLFLLLFFFLEINIFYNNNIFVLRAWQIDESQGLLSGEKVLKTAEGEVVVRQEGGGDLPRKGTLHFTNYRLFLSQEVSHASLQLLLFLSNYFPY
jgi:hypothetical protein